MPSGQAQVGVTCPQVGRINFCVALAVLINNVNLKRDAAMLEINPRNPLAKHRFSNFQHHDADAQVLHPPYF